MSANPASVQITRGDTNVSGVYFLVANTSPPLPIGRGPRGGGPINNPQPPRGGPIAPAGPRFAIAANAGTNELQSLLDPVQSVN
ncbi:MAG: hypothetical protein JO353_14195 [Phycisphaerae bacterium]|nr:hypothetical protein [Phycisphaerae bacterium]